MKKVAICGITGVVGQEILNCLKKTNFPVGEIAGFASERSAGKKIDTPFGKTTIQLFEVEKVQNYDFIFLAVGGDFSKQYAKILTEKGAIVIDKSSTFRYIDGIPLVIPEINPETVKGQKLISTPNCTTSILAVALYPLYKKFGLKKIIVSTYQATSGAGKAGMDELEEESRNFLKGETVKNNVFVHPIPFNIIPHIDKFQENLYTKEEMKIVWETQKIFGDPNLNISCTSVRIPTFRSHAEAVTIETEKPITPEEAREILAISPGIEVVDDPASNQYPMPINTNKKFDVEVGRIRRNKIFGEFGLDFFVCGDQLLKGAALNGVQIAHLFL